MKDIGRTKTCRKHLQGLSAVSYDAQLIELGALKKLGKRRHHAVQVASGSAAAAYLCVSVRISRASVACQSYTAQYAHGRRG